MVSIIFVNAPIGAGKTSLTRMLVADLGTKGFYEEVDKIPMLKEFYAQGEESRNDLSFALQIAFLNYRFGQLREGLHLAERGIVNTVYDSSLISDALMSFNLYKRGEFPEVMYNLYVSLNQNMVSDVAGHPFNGYPDLIVFLDIPFDLMLDHISKRGRDMEDIRKDPKLVDYYYSVWNTYNSWYDSFGQAPVVRVDMSKYDFVNNLSDRNEVLNMIEQKLVDLGKLTQDEFDKIKSKRDKEV